MPYYEFVWTDRARSKIELNGLTLEDVEAIICSPWKVEKSRSSGRPLAMGLADDGRTIA